MNMFNIIVLNSRGDEIMNGTTNFVPRIGEKIKGNWYTYKVEDVIYDFDYGQTYGAIKVAIKVSLI